MADRDGGGARQRGQVDEMGRAVAQSVRQRVGEHKAALGVGVDDLDGLAVGADQHVARALRRRTWHVFGRGHDRHHVERQLARGDHVDGRKHCGRSRHVVLHPAHVVRVLQRDASAVEGDPLADQGEGLFTALGGSAFGVIAVVVVTIAAASVWLFLTEPETAAAALTGGDISPFVNDMARVLLEALRGLLKYL